MGIILIIALLVGGGTSFAAESALPGDVLYPVKVNINEEVRSFVAISDEAQAKWDMRRAERRLEEAEKLAAEGRLNTETRANIEARFESYSKAFQEREKKIAAKQDTLSSFEINSNFEASLETHERVLAQIASEKASVRGEVESLLVNVRARLDTTVETRANIEAEISAKTSGEFKVAAEGKLKAAENKVSEVRGFIAQVKSSVSVNTQVQAEAQLKVAENIVARGKTEMEAQTYGKAFASFQEAIRIAQEAKLIVEAKERIDLEINVPDINVRGGLDMEEKMKTKSKQDTSSGASVESGIKVKSGNGSTGVGGEEKVKINIGL